MRIRMSISAAVVGTAAVLCAASTATAATTPAVHLSRIQYDAPGSDSTHNVDGEYVKITNSGHSAVNLKGWTVRDTARHVYTFPSHTLSAGHSVWLYSGKGRNAGSDLYWGSGWHVWNNNHDSASLRNTHGTSVDSCTWKKHAASGATTC